MFLCCLCRFAVPLDDTLTTTPRGGCICLRCYLRHVEDEKQFPDELRRVVTAVTAAA